MYQPGRRRFGPEPPHRNHRRAQPQRCPDVVRDRVDRISSLPDDLIREVLVRLRCARAAARTSLLSRRWLHLWRTLPKLSFRDVRPDGLVSALSQVTRSDLYLLGIHVLEGGRFSCTKEFVASLLGTAARFAPKEFIFSAQLESITLELPGFHQAKSIRLEMLYPGRYQLVATGSEFPALERLYVSGCTSFADLISRCPRLRALEVCMRNYPDKICVHSTTIEELVVDGVRGIDIAAPVLERLSLSRCHILINIDEFLSQSPRLRSLKLHDPIDLLLRPMVYCSVHSTMIEEIVLDDVEIMGYIRVDAPKLKIFTLRCARLKYPVDIVAPMLKMLTLEVGMDLEVRMLLSAPVVENLSWDCWFSRPSAGIHWKSFLSDLSLHMEDGVSVLSLHITLEHPGSNPPNLKEILPLPSISVLKLNLYTKGHVYGTTVSHLLGIYPDIQRLHLVIQRDLKHDRACRPKFSCDQPQKWRPKCSCDQPQNWRGQDISLSALEVLDIEKFEGTWCDIDFLKLLFRCAPLMKQVTVKPCPDVLPSIRACKEICNLFKAHPSVKCYVYDSCGKKAMYDQSAYASRCNRR